MVEVSTLPRLARLANLAAMRSFDISAYGRRIIFDRIRQNSGIVVIDLPKAGR